MPGSHVDSNNEAINHLHWNLSLHLFQRHLLLFVNGFIGGLSSLSNISEGNFNIEKILIVSKSIIMTGLFFKYYIDVTKYNVLFTLLVAVTTQKVFAILVSFGIIGNLVSFFIYSYFQSIEYYFYLNGGLSKSNIILRGFLINFIISLIIFIVLWKI